MTGASLPLNGHRRGCSSLLIDHSRLDVLGSQHMRIPGTGASSPSVFAALDLSHPCPHSTPAVRAISKHQTAWFTLQLLFGTHTTTLTDSCCSFLLLLHGASLLLLTLAFVNNGLGFLTLKLPLPRCSHPSPLCCGKPTPKPTRRYHKYLWPSLRSNIIFTRSPSLNCRLCLCIFFLLFSYHLSLHPHSTN